MLAILLIAIILDGCSDDLLQKISSNWRIWQQHYRQVFTLSNDEVLKFLFRNASCVFFCFIAIHIKFYYLIKRIYKIMLFLETIFNFILFLTDDTMKYFVFFLVLLICLDVTCTDKNRARTKKLVTTQKPKETFIQQGHPVPMCNMFGCGCVPPRNAKCCRGYRFDRRSKQCRKVSTT